MLPDKETAQRKLMEWDDLLHGYSLPQWENFPTLSLYMDQVIYLLNQYLTLTPRAGEERAVTSAMINNYVKLKIIPPPVKKRYSRTHLAYLMMVCALKQSISTAEIRRLLPLNLSEDDLQAVYLEFITVFGEEKDRFRERLRDNAAAVLAEDGPSVSRLILQAAVSANLSQSLAEQLLALSDSLPAEEEQK